MRADMLPFEARNLILVRWLQTSVISISGGGRWTMYAACPGDTTMLSRWPRCGKASIRLAAESGTAPSTAAFIAQRSSWARQRSVSSLRLRRIGATRPTTTSTTRRRGRSPTTIAGRSRTARRAAIEQPRDQQDRPDPERRRAGCRTSATRTSRGCCNRSKASAAACSTGRCRCPREPSRCSAIRRARCSPSGPASTTTNSGIPKTQGVAHGANAGVGDQHRRHAPVEPHVRPLS
jgi:hypothetical protein